LQFTMYAEKDDDAIYQSDMASNTLFKKIYEAQQEYQNIFVGDNMNSGSCGAGMCSLGILADGDVVPCLSMRSWVEDIDDEIQNNILTLVPYNGNVLKQIWETGFTKQRFEQFKCCKDHCMKKSYQDYINSNKNSLLELLKKGMADPIITTSPMPTSPIYIYGVREPNVVMYAVQAIPNTFDPNITMVYGVQKKDPPF